MSDLRSHCRNLMTSSQAVAEIVDVLARDRLQLSHGKTSLTAELIKHAENKLNLFGKEADNHES